MNSSSDYEIFIPNTYNGILSFINENRTLISNDLKLIFRIYSILDNLLKTTNNMGDLHKDTRIVLETIKLQLESFIKQYKSEISLSKMLLMADTDQLDDFFEYLSSNSLAIKFVDRLEFQFKQKESVTRNNVVKINDDVSEEITPEKFVPNDDQRESDFEIQNIKTRIYNEKAVEFFQLIFDPSSFSRTIKNAFNLALALRMKQISLFAENNCLYAIPYDGRNSELDHSVFEISPFLYNRLKEKMKNIQSNSK